MTSGLMAKSNTFVVDVIMFRDVGLDWCRPAMAKGRHSEGPLWYRVSVRVRVMVSDWRTFAMAALRYSGPSLWRPQTVRFRLSNRVRDRFGFEFSGFSVNIIHN